MENKKIYTVKSLAMFLLKIIPCFILFSFTIDSTSFLFKNIMFFTSAIYILLVLFKSNILTSILLASSYVAFGLLTNIAIQKEVTYVFLSQFIVVYLFSLYYVLKNNKLENVIIGKEKKLNKDYITGLYNKKYLDELLLTDYSPSIKDSYIIALEIEDFKHVISNIGYTSSEVMLREIGKIIKFKANKNGIAFRVYGESFIILVDKSDDVNVQNLVSSLKNSIENKLFVVNNKEINVLVSISTISSNNFINCVDYVDKSISSLKNARYNYEGVYYEVEKKIRKRKNN